MPSAINGTFSCSKNNLETLQFGPKTVTNNFMCGNNKLTSLEFCPEEIGGEFNFSQNNVNTLKFIPEVCFGIVVCDVNPLPLATLNPIRFSDLVTWHKQETSIEEMAVLENKYSNTAIQQRKKL